MKLKILNYMFLSSVLFSLVACQPAGQYYLNALADQTMVKPLPVDSETEVKWQDMYLDINHKISATESDVSIQGTVGFSNHPQIMYARAHDLKVSLFLLDGNNRVVAYRKILQSGKADPEEIESFKSHLQRPAGAVAYTFGYEVGFLEGEPDTGGTMIWTLPAADK